MSESNMMAEMQMLAEQQALRAPASSETHLHATSDRLAELLLYIWLCEQTKDDYSLPACYESKTVYDA